MYAVGKRSIIGRWWDFKGKSIYHGLYRTKNGEKIRPWQRERDYGRVLRYDDAIYGLENRAGMLDALTPFDRLIRPR